MLAFQDSIQEMGRNGRWDLPLPGAGQTPRRLLMLSQIARRDLAAGRIAEALRASARCMECGPWTVPSDRCVPNALRMWDGDCTA
jgi:hypothetical protein